MNLDANECRFVKIKVKCKKGLEKKRSLKFWITLIRSNQSALTTGGKVVYKVFHRGFREES